MPVTLRPVGLHWLGGDDRPSDLCAHGDFELRIGDDTLSDGTQARGLTLSAAALYLLRTLSSPHTSATPVGDHLFPCCGFCLYGVPGERDVLIVGCPGGEDLEVDHGEDGSGVLVRSAGGREWAIDWSSWKTAVFSFADAVSAFYASSAPREPAPEDAAGFRAFVAEWERRRGRPFGRVTDEQDGPSGGDAR